MGENVPEVVPEQRLPWILFGDGSQGQLLRKNDNLVDKEGVRISEIRFRPTKELMVVYGISEDELDEESSIVRRFPSSKILSLSEDPTQNTILVFCGVNGEETRLTNMHASLFDTIEGYEKRIKSLTAQNAWLHSEIKKMTSSIDEYIKDRAKMFLNAIKVRGDIDSQFPVAGGENQNEGI